MSKLPKINMAGKLYGRLTAIDYIGADKWSFICACGNKIEAFGSNVRYGRQISCGCFRIEKARSAKKHGFAGNRTGNHKPEYAIWRAMRSRCFNKKDSGYHRYGGRGIFVCERWKDFCNFIKDMGERPSPMHSIERINNLGNYEPSNCCWATRKAQQRNRRITVFVEYDGVKIPLAQFCEENNLPYERTRQRIRDYGWSAKKCLSC